MKILRNKNNKMPTQTTFGQKEKKITDKKVIKLGNLKFYQSPEKTPESILEEIENVYHRSKFYALFSGGKDSMTATHLLDSMGKLESVVHIKTNIGLQMTTDFVIEICEKMGWPLRIIEPNPKFTIVAQALENGFGNPQSHRIVMGRLKFKTMRDFALSIDRDNHCLISGIRSMESNRRMGNYLGPIQSNGAMWFGNPIFYMSSEDTYAYVHKHGLKISPAYAKGFAVSGECMCGCFSTDREKLMIKEHDPKLAAFIEWMEDGIQRFGTTRAKKYPTWGSGSKMTDIQQQEQMESFFKDNPELKPVDEMESLICGTECGAGTLRESLSTKEEVGV